MSDPVPVLDDLRAESEELDDLVGGLSQEQWLLDTPAPRWTVAHQIAHLAWTDRAALIAATEPEAFPALLGEAQAAPTTFVDTAAEEGAEAAPADLLVRWRAGREELQKVLRAAPAGHRFPWYGPSMGVGSMGGARLMETWAHGQDVADALGVRRTPTDRLRHVARIGTRARDYAYAVQGSTPPAELFRVELTAPTGAGETWAFGPEDARQRVTGPALDFCLLVTQRAHRADLDLRAEGPDADHWLDIAQAFAGPPGPGRAPRAGGGEDHGDGRGEGRGEAR